MADASYDAVVIGGGPNGLTLACYLANAGMEVAVLERQHELGGGACGEELPLPGFLSNPCANFHAFFRSPPWRDFKLWEKGAKYIFSELAPAALFDDGTCLQGYPIMEVVDPLTTEDRYSPGNVERNLKEIARFSQRDAETGSILIEKYLRKWHDAYWEWALSPPAPWGEKDAIERLLDDPVDGIDPMYQMMTCKEVAYDLFESKELRTRFMRSALSSTGCYPGDVMHVADAIDRFRVILSVSSPAAFPASGTHTIAHALQKALTEMGGKFFVHHEVDRILIDNGAANGVRLVDGTEIEAKKLVVSDVDPNQTLLRFVGEDNISPQLARRVRNFSYDRANLFWVHVAIHELPKYKAADFNPDCLRASKVEYLPKDSEALAEKHQMEIFSQGIPEKLYLLVGIDSMVDKTRAPEGKHNVLFEQFAAPARYFSEREWLRMKKEIVAEIVRQWQWYAPNMTWDNVIGAYANTPLDVANRNINMLEGSWSVGAHTASQMGRFRPCPELSRYQVPNINNLYLCGAGQHYGGTMSGRSGYNCYKVIAQDLGLPKVWEEKGRPY
jgi:beta-carotene ketolase (CrtO type)